MFDPINIMNGMKTFSQLREELKHDEMDTEDITKFKLKLKEENFKDFAEVNKENKEDFRCVAACLIVTYLENMDKIGNLALEFPELLNAQARSIIHSLVDFLGIRSISMGKGESRRIMVFPKQLFQKAWEKEQEKIAKEKEKLRLKYKDMKFQGEPDSNAFNTRDKIIRELYFE